MKWFKHDSDANTDAKLKRVRMKYGMEGYGLYWYCLELIASGVDKHRLTFELEHDSEIIAYDTGIHREVVEEMMMYFVDLKLFENSSGTITCLKMANRTDEYIAKIIRSDSGHTPDNVRTISDKKPDKVPSNRIEQKRREKSFTPPTVEQVHEYCTQRGNSVDPQRFVDHYEANGWFRGKTKMKDWKACVRTWEKNEPKAERYGEGGI